jgi:hypothetical protein
MAVDPNQHGRSLRLPVCGVGPRQAWNMFRLMSKDLIARRGGNRQLVFQGTSVGSPVLCSSIWKRKNLWIAATDS